MAEGFFAPTAFIKNLVETMGFRERRPSQHVSDIHISFLDLSRLKLELGVFVPFVASTALSRTTDVDPEELRVLINQAIATSKQELGLQVFLVDTNLKHIPSDLAEELHSRGIAVLDRRTMAEIWSTYIVIAYWGFTWISDELGREITHNLEEILPPDYRDRLALIRRDVAVENSR